MASSDSAMVFFDEQVGVADTTPLAEVPRTDKRWVVMIVDDDEEVHSITTLVLKNFSFGGKGLRFLHAYSAEQAKTLLVQHPETAVILLDVVMERHDSGLEVVEYVREELENPFVRIILRTGQPGHAPEERVIVDYDINDYKEKTELSSQKLFTVMFTSLRTYRDILVIDANRRGLRRIIDASSSLFQLRSLKQLASGVMTQLVSILNLDPNAVMCEMSGFAAANCFKRFEVLAATGRFEELVEDDDANIPFDIRTRLEEAVEKKSSVYFSDRYVGYMRSQVGSEIVIYCEGWNQMGELNKSLIEIFCANVNIAFENAYLNREIEDTQKEIIYALGEIAEARSLETGTHVKRVSEYCRIIAEHLGLSEHDLEVLRMASPMHDVGKVAIPDSILNHPGPLTADEFEIMKRHTVIGSEMLQSSTREIMKAASLIAEQHHERFNGTGYPKGLEGDEIHIFARITAVADVFDALCNDRVYRKAWEMPAILDYFRRERGRHFDPELVDILLNNIGEFLELKEML